MLAAETTWRDARRDQTLADLIRGCVDCQGERTPSPRSCKIRCVRPKRIRSCESRADRYQARERMRLDDGGDLWNSLRAGATRRGRRVSHHEIDVEIAANARHRFERKNGGVQRSKLYCLNSAPRRGYAASGRAISNIAPPLDDAR